MWLFFIIVRISFLRRLSSRAIMYYCGWKVSLTSYTPFITVMISPLIVSLFIIVACPFVIVTPLTPEFPSVSLLVTLINAILFFSNPEAFRYVCYCDTSCSEGIFLTSLTLLLNWYLSLLLNWYLSWYC